MIDLTREQAIKNFRKMWNWIADETEKRQTIVQREDYFKENNIVEIPTLYCYVCAVTYLGCWNCPIKWSNRGLVCTDSYSEFREWLAAISDDDYRRASKMARKISELKEREVTE